MKILNKSFFIFATMFLLVFINTNFVFASTKATITFLVDATKNSSEEVSTDIATFVNDKKSAFEAQINNFKTTNSGNYDNFEVSDFSALFSNTQYAVFDSTDIGAPSDVGGVEVTPVTVIYHTVQITQPSQNQKINTINLTVSAPAVGTKIVNENTKPIITLPSDANYTVSWTMFVNNYPSADPTYDNGAIFGTTIEAGKPYFLEAYLAPKPGYEFDAQNNVTVTVNGGKDYELGYCSDNQFAIFTKAQATITSSTENKTTESKSTYTVLNGENQVVNISSNEPFSFRFSIPLKKFEQEGKIFIDKNLISKGLYTLTEGSTIITFSDELKNSLTPGEHTIKVAVSDGEVSTKFTVKKDETPVGTAASAPAPTSATTATTAPATTATKNIKNPKTGDGLFTNIALLVVSILGIIATVIVIKKNK